ncbi:glycosyltransferase [Massilia sp. TWP1-3-3]|uniref:glycosyltransferase n=1 Tax=Massilia sp. TWP1-3-3 TaxID=2804573 RepID=UPI003CE80299
MSAQTILLLTVRADHGGGPEHMLSLLKGLHRRHRFIIGAPAGQAYSQRFAEYGALAALPFRRFSLRAFLQLARLVRREGVTVIHSHGKGAGIYGRLLGLVTGRPVIHTFHGFHFRHLSPPKRLIYLTIERWLARCTALLLNVSMSESQMCAEAGLLAGGRGVVIPNGVAVSPELAPHRERTPPAILINVARHEPEKGVDGVLAIAQVLSARAFAYELWLVGDGEQAQQLRAQVHSAGITERVRFLGFRDDVATLLCSADLFVSASHGEGMPLTLLEAMAAGLPSVASDVVGNQDVVENGRTGFLFALNAPQQAADAIMGLMADPTLYQRCAQTAHARAREKYSVEAMCERIDQVYAEVAAINRMEK